MRIVPLNSNLQLKLARIVRDTATAYGVLALGIVLSAAAGYWVANQVAREARLKFENAVSDAHDAIETRTHAYTDVLLGIRGMFNASNAISRREFRDYVASLDLNRRYPGIQVIHYAQHITAAQKQAFEMRLRNDSSVAPAGYPDFGIKPPGDRPEYVVVQYVEPMAGNEAALGLDLGGDAVRLAALTRVRDSGAITASGAIALALDPSRHPGFAVRLPIYRKGMPLASVTQRRDAFIGVVSASFVVIDLMHGVLSEPFLQSIHVRIHDAGILEAPNGLQPPAAANRMFDSDRLLKSPLRPVASGNAALTRESGLEVGGRRWNISFSAREGFVPAFDRLQPWLVFVGGLVISLLLFGLIRSLAVTNRRAVMLAENITADLRRSEAGLATAQRMTQELIEVLPTPIYFKGTDGRYLGVNRAWEKFFGMSRETVIGKTVHDLYPNDPDLAARLHATDQALWDRPGVQEYETPITTASGRHYDTIYYKATFTHADGSVAGLIGAIVDITERKQAEATHARLAAIVDASNDAIVSRDISGKILSWNRGAEALFGYGAAEMMGRDIRVLVPPALHHEFRVGQEALHRFRVHESFRLAKDGRLINVSVSAAPIRDAAGSISAVALIFRDITERKLAERAQAQLAAIVETSNDAIIGRTSDDTIVSWNAAAERMYGWRADEALGKSFRNLVPRAPGSTRLWRFEQLLRGEPVPAPSDDIRRRKDGTYIHGQTTMSAVKDERGKVLFVSCIIRDITERKQAEDARVLLEAQLRESQKMEAIGTLAGGIAHDFNNIIAVILGNTVLAREDAGDIPHALQSLEEIHKAASRARDLVQQILAFSRRQPTDRKPTALAPLVLDTARLLRATLPVRLSVDVHCDPEVPLVQADATHIQQALINLATNAMQAIPSGSGRIAIRLDTVMLDARLVQAHSALRNMIPGRAVRLTVSDTGPGMDAATLARIFEPFFTTKPVGEGTGLGLSVVHGIVQAHNGAIVVESHPGQGTAFTLYLPLTEAQANASAASASAALPRLPPSPLAGPSPVGGLHVLYIDDDTNLVFLVKRLLERRGYRVSDHTNSREALAALRADPAAFDLLLTDYNMPGMSGLDVAREVRAIRADLPVAVASGFVDETLQAHAAAAGVHELIFKADSVEAFCEAVERLARTVMRPSKSL